MSMDIPSKLMSLVIYLNILVLTRRIRLVIIYHLTVLIYCEC